MDESRVSVIIPTLDEDPITLDSVPEGVETAVVSEGNRPEARNIGVERTDGEILVFCDDDIVFGESFFWEQVENTPRGTVRGVEDFDFGLLLTRFLVVHRSDFERLSGFDERINHMEDTEFCLNVLSDGMTVETINREMVRHKDHESVGQGRLAIIKGAIYICTRYPRYTPLIIKGLIF